jgi:hypothetical protein
VRAAAVANDLYRSCACLPSQCLFDGACVKAKAKKGRVPREVSQPSKPAIELPDGACAEHRQREVRHPRRPRRLPRHPAGLGYGVVEQGFEGVGEGFALLLDRGQT